MGLFLYSSSQVNETKTNSKGRKIVLSLSQLCKMVPPSQQEFGMQAQTRAFYEALRCLEQRKFHGRLGKSPITTQNYPHCGKTGVRGLGLQVRKFARG